MSGNPKVLTVSPIEHNGSNYVRPFRLEYSLDGKSLKWDCVKAHDSVAIILHNTDRNTLVLVKQFRPALVASSAVKLEIDKGEIVKNPKVSGYTLECCAGIIDKEGKSDVEIAREEILEETGYDVPISSIQFVTSVRSGVGIQGSLHSIFFSPVCDKQRVSKGGGVLDERIEVVELTIEEAKKLLWCHDEDMPFSRPASMLVAIVWFVYEYYPKFQSEQKR